MCAHLALGKLDAHGEHVTLALLHRFLDLIVAHAAGTGPGSRKQRQGDSQGGRRRDAGGWRRQPQSERWRSQRRVLTIPHAAPSGLHNTAACKRVQGLPHRAAPLSGPAPAVQALGPWSLVGEIPPRLQVELLRGLQGGKFERVGGNETLKVDVRLDPAPHPHPADDVKKGRFPEDPY